jgi:hypothetical protein
MAEIYGEYKNKVLMFATRATYSLVLLVLFFNSYSQELNGTYRYELNEGREDGMTYSFTNQEQFEYISIGYFGSRHEGKGTYLISNGELILSFSIPPEPKETLWKRTERSSLIESYTSVRMKIVNADDSLIRNLWPTVHLLDSAGKAVVSILSSKDENEVNFNYDKRLSSIETAVVRFVGYEKFKLDLRPFEGTSSFFEVYLNPQKITYVPSVEWRFDIEIQKNYFILKGNSKNPMKFEKYKSN